MNKSRTDQVLAALQQMEPTEAFIELHAVRMARDLIELRLYEENPSEWRKHYAKATHRRQRELIGMVKRAQRQRESETQ